MWLFHAPAWLNTEQVSNELRYNGQFADRANVTVGTYYFKNELNYHERRELLGIATGGVAPASTFDGGGDYDVETLGLFVAVDYDLSDQWTLNTGVRYTPRRKRREHRVAQRRTSIRPAISCLRRATVRSTLSSSDDWSNVSPKIGVTYEVNDDSRYYGALEPGRSLRRLQPAQHVV